MARLNTDQEAQRLLSIYGGDTVRLMELLERQFQILHQRGQMLLGLAGVIITVTGFSGRLIAGTSRAAQWLIVSGVSTTLASAMVVVAGVLYLRWLTQQPGETTGEWLLNALRYRDHKTRFYRIAILLLLIGATLYVGAIAIMLLNPDANSPTSIR